MEHKLHNSTAHPSSSPSLSASQDVEMSTDQAGGPPPYDSGPPGSLPQIIVPREEEKGAGSMPPPDVSADPLTLNSDYVALREFVREREGPGAEERKTGEERVVM